MKCPKCTTIKDDSAFVTSKGTRYRNGFCGDCDKAHNEYLAKIASAAKIYAKTASPNIAADITKRLRDNHGSRFSFRGFDTEVEEGILALIGKARSGRQRLASKEARAWMKTMKTPRPDFIGIKGEGMRGNAVPSVKSTGPAEGKTPDEFAHQAFDVQHCKCATCEREFGKWEELDANHRQRLVPVQSHVLKPRASGGLAADVFATCDLCNRFLNKQKGLNSLGEAKARCKTFKEKKGIKVVE